MKYGTVIGEDYFGELKENNELRTFRVPWFQVRLKIRYQLDWKFCDELFTL